MKVKKVLALVLAFAMMCGCLTGCGGGETAEEPAKEAAEAVTESTKTEARVIKIGIPEADTEAFKNYHYQYYVDQLNIHLEELSGGSIQFECVGGGQMGTEAECFSGLSDGSLDAACVSLDAYASQIPELQLFGLPYMFNYLGQFQVLTENEEFMAPVYETFENEWNIICLSSPAYCGYREMLSNKPVNTVADLKDMVVRNTTSPLISRDWEALGAIPTSIPYNEAYTALQQGVCDSLEVPIEAQAMMGFYEVADYLIMVDMHDLIGWPMMSKACWETFTEEEQGWIKEASELAVKEQISKLEGNIADIIDMYENEYGITVIYPDLDEFKAATRVVHEEYRDIIGSDFLDKAYELLDVDNAEKGYALWNE